MESSVGLHGVLRSSAAFAALCLGCAGGTATLPGKSEPARATPTTLDAGDVVALDAKPRDWMWEVVGGTGDVHWRWSDGTCERWTLEIDGLPARYRGTVARAAEAGSPALAMAYDGNGPRLSSPAVRSGGAKGALALPCDGDDTGAWYLTASDCELGGPPPLKPTGCLSAISPGERARLARASRGEAQADLRAAFTRAKKAWLRNGCEPRVVRTTKDKIYLNDTHLYPTLAKWTPTGVSLEEQAESNPDRVAPKGGGSIAIGCCSRATTYHILDFANGVADVIAYDERDPEKTRRERWWLDQAPPAEVLATCKSTSP
jgi:hypothetical protein